MIPGTCAILVYMVNVIVKVIHVLIAFYRYDLKGGDDLTPLYNTGIEDRDIMNPQFGGEVGIGEGIGHLRNQNFELAIEWFVVPYIGLLSHLRQARLAQRMDLECK